MLRLTELSYCCFLSKVYDADKNKFKHDVIDTTNGMWKIIDDKRDSMLQNYFGHNPYLFKHINHGAVRFN